MKGQYSGVMSVDEFYQALIQDIDFFRKHYITHIKSVSLYFTPCDDAGNALVVRNATGDIIDGYISAGAYQCAAQFYESVQLEPTPVPRKTVAAGSAFKPRM